MGPLASATSIPADLTRTMGKTPPYLDPECHEALYEVDAAPNGLTVMQEPSRIGLDERAALAVEEKAVLQEDTGAHQSRTLK